MKLTLLNRLKLCYEILTVTSGHGHTAQEKLLSTFQRGYAAGRHDEQLVTKTWPKYRNKLTERVKTGFRTDELVVLSAGAESIKDIDFGPWIDVAMKLDFNELRHTEHTITNLTPS